MTSTLSSARPAGRTRDLPLLRLEVVTGEGASKTFESVLCPRERRVRPVEECAPCVDGAGRVDDPTTRGGFLACDARVAPPPVRGGDARSAADATPASDVMTRSVLALCADVPLAVARAALLDAELDAVPVVDRAGRLVGCLGQRDLLRASAAMDDGRQVADAMSRRAASVSEAAPLSEVAAAMARDGLSLVPAVARDGRVVGVVTALDLVRWLAAQDDRGPRQLP